MKIHFFAPIANIMKGAGEISHGQLGCQIKEEGAEEVSELANTINKMASELSRNLSLIHI